MSAAADTGAAAIRAAARAAMDGKCKPPGSLGLLEDWAVQLCELQGTLAPRVDGACLLVFCGDHGVTRARPEVSAYPRAVTPAMRAALARGQAAAAVLCAAGGVDAEVVDVGVDDDDDGGDSGVGANICSVNGGNSGVHFWREKVARGSASFVDGPAMTEAQCAAAMAAGAAAVARACERAAAAATAAAKPSPLRIVLAIGELGIGNTTAAAALLSALTGAPPEQTVGRGTGVDDAGLAAKRAAVADALAANADLIAAGGALGALRAVGGLELAAMAGAYLEAARRRLPAIVDGFISGAAALAAARHDPSARAALFGSHRSAEAGAVLLLRELGLSAPLDMGLRLGEGTGAVLALPLLRAAAAVVRDMTSLQEVLAAATAGGGGDSADGAADGAAEEEA